METYDESDECVDDTVHEARTSESTSVTCIRATNQFLRLNRSIKWRCKPQQEQNQYVRNLQASLEYPVGASFASIMLRPPNIIPQEYLSIESYATCLMAFGEIYITPEEEWDTLVLNRIITDGKKHTQESLEKIEDELLENFDGSINETLIEKTFVKCGNMMEIDVISPFIVGTVVSKRKEIPDFHYGIEKFMRKFTYSLLTVDNFYFLIWKNDGIYFVFDCFGRNNKLERNSTTGTAVLIAVARVMDVNHLIVNLSNFKGSETFVLRNIRMKAIYPCCDFINKMERRIRQQEYQIINDNCAFLRGHYEISSPCFKENRNKFSLAVAIVALIYSKIDPPSTWDSYCIDKTLFLANNFYSLWTNCLHHRDLRISQIPNEIQLGKYVANISVSHPEACGKWRSLANYKSSDLAKSIEEIFEKTSNLIVNMSDRWYALMKRASFYYLLDPYKHDCQRNSKEKGPSAELYICNTLSYLICIFINNVIESTNPVTFNIHNVKILDIRSSNVDNNDEIQSCECIGDLSKKIDDEVATLNLSIDDVTCMQQLQCEFLEERDKIDCVNLDSPSLSQTQIVSFELSDDENEEEEEEESDDEEESETDDSDLSSDTDDEGRRKRKKKSKSKHKDKKGKGKKDKDKKKKNKMIKDKKGKDKKVKDKKVKDKKVKDKKVKDKKVKDKNVKDKKVKEKKVKDKKVKEKKVKDKKNKDKKDRDKDTKDKDKKSKEKKDKKKKDKGKKDKDRKDKDMEDTDTDDSGEDSTDTEGTDTEGTGTEDTDKEEMDKDEMGKEEENIDGKGSVEISSGRSSSEIDSMASDEIGIHGSKICLQNSYPGFSTVPFNITVVGSKTGSYSSLCSLLQLGFKCADRILTMTPWGNYIVFDTGITFLLYEGCTCNVSRFRHLDVTVGTAGLLCFNNLHDLIEYIIDNKSPKLTNVPEDRNLDNIIDEYCNPYCK